MTFSTLPLSYCTNVHPGRTLDEVVAGISDYTADVRRRLNAPIAAGLWLSRTVVTELTDSEAALERLAQVLWQHDLCCYTLNAFPYGDFHTDRVKEQVYLPDWAASERVAYTKDCARILSQLIPEGAEGSISTVPLGGRMNPTGPKFHATCFHHLVQMAKFLRDLHQETGRMIRLAIEPEPMCEMCSVPGDVLPQFKIMFDMADALNSLDVVREHIGVCFDVCHQAVIFEDVQQSIDLLTAAEIRINKIHITNAIELEDPASNPAGRTALCEYVEPRYLHQTYARAADGKIMHRPDLLAEDINCEPADSFMQADAWRVHFHVPVYADELGPLKTTRPELKAALRKVREINYAPHLEVETYTWPVMPDCDDATTDLAQQIATELESAAALMYETGPADS